MRPFLKKSSLLVHSTPGSLSRVTSLVSYGCYRTPRLTSNLCVFQISLLYQSVKDDRENATGLKAKSREYADYPDSSALGFAPENALESKLTEALAKSPSFQHEKGTLVPANFSANFSADDVAHPAMQEIYQTTQKRYRRAKELGVGLTLVYAGLHEPFFFGDK